MGATSLNTSVPTRDIGYNVIQAISATVNFNTLGIGTADTVVVGKLPAGAQCLTATVRVNTAFNALTTNVLTVGSAAGSDADIVADGDVDETSTGATSVVRPAGLTFAADTTIYAKYTQSGTAATTGSAVITIPYFVVQA